MLLMMLHVVTCSYSKRGDKLCAKQRVKNNRCRADSTGFDKDAEHSASLLN